MLCVCARVCLCVMRTVMLALVFSISYVNKHVFVSCSCLFVIALLYLTYVCDCARRRSSLPRAERVGDVIVHEVDQGEPNIVAYVACMVVW